MDESEVIEILKTVDDPALGGDIYSCGLINDINIDGDAIAINLALGAPYSPKESLIATAIRDAFSEYEIELDLSARIPDRDENTEDSVLPFVKNVIAVSSGKGGVGKSTVAVNLAVGLSKMGAQVGLFDADIYGPNVPRMVDADEPPRATKDETLVPPEKYGVKLMSMAFLVGEDDPVIWRGPIVHKVITQLTEDVEWGHLDYLVIDLPPGTGDTQLTMLQTIPVTGAVIVTTPQDVALDDARKGLEMFARHDTVVLGIIENMASFVCPDCGNQHNIFGSGGGEKFAETHNLPFLGSIPLDPAVRDRGDSGNPVVLDSDDEPAGAAFMNIVESVADNVGIVHRKAVADSKQQPVDELP